jgi:hypothetical protein
MPTPLEALAICKDIAKMSAKPETNLIARIHKKLPSKIEHFKMANPYVSGVWDVYYDSPSLDGWVEYKYMDRLWKPIDFYWALEHLLTPRQRYWGEQRLANGRNMAIIVGFKDKDIAIAAPTRNSRTQDLVQPFARFDAASAAEWITNWLGETHG